MALLAFVEREVRILARNAEVVLALLLTSSALAAMYSAFSYQSGLIAAAVVASLFHIFFNVIREDEVGALDGVRLAAGGLAWYTAAKLLSSLLLAAASEYTYTLFYAAFSGGRVDPAMPLPLALYVSASSTTAAYLALATNARAVAAATLSSALLLGFAVAYARNPYDPTLYFTAAAMTAVSIITAYVIR